MKRLICGLAVGLGIAAQVSFAQNSVTEEWVARYDGPAGALDIAGAIAVDSEGEGLFYVTGGSFDSDSGRDYATVKYSPAGEQLWVARYNGPAGENESAHALALDGEGNVYVTGVSLDSAGTDYATVKYSSEGEELWVARYDGPAGENDSANALALDSEGNVCVTGASYGLGTWSDYATVKYSSTGEKLWVARYEGPAGGSDGANALAVDSEGNVYVTGDSHSTGRVLDYATIKYDSTGKELWVARYDGPAGDHDKVEALALDSEGNVYVTGWSLGEDTGVDYATVKYSSEGEELWVARYDGLTAGRVDQARALALDSQGNVYVTGNSDDPGTRYDFATVKYNNTAGEELWVARYDGPAGENDQAEALALDSAGNVYVTGTSFDSAGTEWDFATVKYSQGFGPEIIPADCNADGALDLGDAICLLGYLFGGAPDALPCGDGTVTDPGNVELINSNGDGGIDLADAVYVLTHLFASGPPPVLGTECVAISGCPDACANKR